MKKKTERLVAMKISVVVAMFNEEESVPILIDSLQQLENSKEPEWIFEFLLVDDKSRDQTVLRVKERIRALKNFTLIEHQTNKGFGGAFRTGIENSSGEVVVCYDADCTYPTNDILVLTRKLLEGYDLVSANPFYEETIIKKVPFYRQVLTLSNAFLYKLAIGQGARNVKIFSCAFRAYDGDIIRQTPFRSNGFGAASEVLGRFLVAGRSVVEVPSTLTTRRFGQSKMKVSKAILDHFKNIFLFLRIRWLNY